MVLRLGKQYLNLPVSNGAEMRRVRLVIGGQTVREFEIELAEDKPDFWVFLSISGFRGCDAQLEVDGLTEGSPPLSLIHQDDVIRGAENLYGERLRPQFHFSSRRGWNNDPNGLVYYKGEYHLFYQHNPYGWKWGNMHWGHAISPDLVHWRELPIAIYPYQFGDWAFSGGALVDWNNSAEFKTGDDDVIIATYTSTGRGECIAYSNDRGRTFTDYAGNPVVKHQGRDPKVIWYEPGGHWAMAVYDEFEDKQYIAFHTSADLKTWEFQSRLEGYYECPEIFELPVDGDANNRKWVVYAADGAYAIGSFDGKTFAPESGKHQFNYGNCFYASQTYSDVPAPNARRIQIAWGRVGDPEMPFNQMMNFPVELRLRTVEDGVRMFAQPVTELGTLHERSHIYGQTVLSEDANPLSGIAGDLFDIRVEFEPGDATEVELTVRGIPLVYKVQEQQLVCQDKHASLAPRDGSIRLQLLVDRLSIEIFANEGEVYMPMGMKPAEENRSLSAISRGGNARVRALEVYELRSAW